MPKFQNSNKPWSRGIYTKPIHSFGRGGSTELFDTKTFTCVYVNFCSIGITIKPILGENYTTTNIENCKVCICWKIDSSGVTPMNGS